MRIPETPEFVEDLDLMRRLDDYAHGRDSYIPDTPLGRAAQSDCKVLHAKLLQLANLITPILDSVNAREMEVFTMHDGKHALKVAHLMWHILSVERRKSLTPPEIGLMVSASYVHDLGMFLSKDDRSRRLATESDIWDTLEVNDDLRNRIATLRKKISDETDSARQIRLQSNLMQAIESLLLLDTRERHATRSRYEEILGDLKKKSTIDIGIPDIESCLIFGTDSFRDLLIDICISHNESEDFLLARRPTELSSLMFPTEFPIGSSTANLLFVAASLRMADILDFDRERTPRILYYYFLPTDVEFDEDKSLLEWQKHLSITNWYFDEEKIVFQGVCNSHIVHHAIVYFCREIEQLVLRTKTVWEAGTDQKWPFRISPQVRAQIHTENYTYLPLQFELDDSRIFEILMGRSIYPDRLDAVRELLQNAVDACRFKDALVLANRLDVVPSKSNRIFVEYVEPTPNNPQTILSVQDTGCGMSRHIVTEYLLKVGRSFFCSNEFNKQRVALRRKTVDFAPVSEFGIGFLSCFLLGNRVRVETAPSDVNSDDVSKLTLDIHGPMRLIRLTTEENAAINKWSGTKVSIILAKFVSGVACEIPTFREVVDYIRQCCIEVPYSIHLRRIVSGVIETATVEPKDLQVPVPSWLKDIAYRIDVDDENLGIEGEIIFYADPDVEKKNSEIAKNAAVRIVNEEWPSPHLERNYSMLLRGGFRLSDVPGLPHARKAQPTAVLRLNWQNQPNKRFHQTDLSRHSIARAQVFAEGIFRVWLTHLLEHRSTLPRGLLRGLSAHRFPYRDQTWMQKFSAFDLYELGIQGWGYGGSDSNPEILAAWENGLVTELHAGFGMGDLSWNLLDLVLPIVCEPVIDAFTNFYVSAPNAGWKDVLKNCHDFIVNKREWTPFGRYQMQISDKLMMAGGGGPRCLNAIYRDVVAARFDNHELEQLTSGLYTLAIHEKRLPAPLTSSQLQLVRRAQEYFGELQIGTRQHMFRLSEFNLVADTTTM